MERLFFIFFLFDSEWNMYLVVMLPVIWLKELIIQKAKPQKSQKFKMLIKTSIRLNNLIVQP